MIEPSESDIGRSVLYRDERGIISSFNEHFVFVRYGNDPGSKATSREDLEFDDDLTFLASVVFDDDDDPEPPCTHPDGHKWVFSDDESYHGEGRRCAVA